MSIRQGNQIGEGGGGGGMTNETAPDSKVAFTEKSGDDTILTRLYRFFSISRHHDTGSHDNQVMA
jgi:hypothetical protein